MREISASEARTHLPQLLDNVNGRAITCLVPDSHSRQTEIDDAIDSIEAFRKQTGKLTLDEILSARPNGHQC